MEAASVPPPTEQELEQAALAALTLILLSGQAAQMAGQVTSILTTALTLPVDAAKAAAGLILTAPLETVTPEVQPRTAGHWVARTAAPRRAAYIVSAAKRLAHDRDIGSERRFLGQHLQAEAAKRDAAVRTDAAAAQFGPLLGWRSVRDSASTPSCKLAHGMNYMASHPPTLPGAEDGVRIVAYPGMAHAGNCRCSPGPAWPGGTLLN